MQSLTDVWKESKLYLIGFVALFGIVVGSAFTYQNIIRPLSSMVSVGTVKAASDDDDDTMSYSFYDMSAWLSAYYNAATSPTGFKSLADGDGDQQNRALLTLTAVKGAAEAGEDKWKLATPTWISGSNAGEGKGGKIGGGGSLLGFPDQEVVKGGVFGYLASKTSSSTTDYSYTSLSTRDLSENQYYNSLQSYAYYGASLQSLGIDTSLGGGIMGWHPIRMLAGALIWIFYIIVSFVEKVFALAVAILQVTNPFKWFATAFSYTWISTDTGPLSGIVNLVSSGYKIFSNFGWLVMIPVIVSMLIFMMIFTGGGRQNPQLDQRRRHKFRYGIIYLAFLSIGVPFLGTAYTAGLDAMSASFGSGLGQSSFSADTVILSTYVNNKDWIEVNRMYIPDSAVIEWDTEDGDVSASSKASVRRSALAINALNNTAASNAITATDQSNWNIQQSSTTNNVSKSMSAMLWSYMVGEVYEPSNWETNVKAELTKKSNSDKDITNSITSSALELTKGYQYLGYINANVDGDINPGVTVNDGWWVFGKKSNIGSNFNLFLNKGYADSGNGGIVGQYDGTKIVKLKSNSEATQTPGFELPTNYNGKAVMSYLEMYNYLNSTFTSNKVRVYSTNALASNFTRDSHAAVNQVGSGYVHKFLIWINTVAMLLGLGVLALGYAFGILIGAFRRYINLVNAIFMGTLGFQKGMVQAVAGTIMLIVETLGTLVIYELVKTFYIGIPSVLEGAFASIGTSGIGGTGLVSTGFMTAPTNFYGFILIIFALIISTILLIWATLMLLRIRKPIIDIMDATFTNLINKLFYGDGNVPQDAPKGVNPETSGGMIGGLTALGAGTALGANSNIDGAEGSDGEDGWSAGGSASANGDATSDSNNIDSIDNDGPDARVASSRDTESKGSEVGATGKVDRSSTGGIESATSEAPSDTELLEQVAQATGNGEMMDAAMNATNKATDAIGVSPSQSSQSNQSESNVSEGGLTTTSSASGSTEDAPSSVSDDDSVSITSNVQAGSAHGGLSPDVADAPVSAISSAKSSVEDNDSVQAGNVISTSDGAKRLAERRGQQGNEAAIVAGAVAGASKVASSQAQQVQGQSKQLTAQNGQAQSQRQQFAQAQGLQAGEAARASQSGSKVGQETSVGQRGNQSGQQGSVSAGPSAQSHMKAGSQNVSQGISATASGAKQTAEGVGGVATGVGRARSGDISGAVQAGQSAGQVAQGAKQMAQGVGQTVQGVQQGGSATGQTVGAISSQDQSVYGQQVASSPSGQYQTQSSVSGTSNSSQSSVSETATSQYEQSVSQTAQTHGQVSQASGQFAQESGQTYGAQTVGLSQATGAVSGGQSVGGQYQQQEQRSSNQQIASSGSQTQYSSGQGQVQSQGQQVASQGSGVKVQNQGNVGQHATSGVQQQQGVDARLVQSTGAQASGQFAQESGQTYGAQTVGLSQATGAVSGGQSVGGQYQQQEQRSSNQQIASSGSQTQYSSGQGQVQSQGQQVASQGSGVKVQNQGNVGQHATSGVQQQQSVGSRSVQATGTVSGGQSVGGQYQQQGPRSSAQQVVSSGSGVQVQGQNQRQQVVGSSTSVNTQKQTNMGQQMQQRAGLVGSSQGVAQSRQTQASSQHQSQSVGQTTNSSKQVAGQGQTVQSNASQSLRQAGQNMRQAGQSVRSSVQNLGQGVRQASIGATQVASGAGRMSAGDITGGQQVAQGARQTSQGVRQTAKGVRQAASAAGNAGRAAINTGRAGVQVTQEKAQQTIQRGQDVAQRVTNSTPGRVIGAVGGTSAKAMAPIGNHVARNTSRMWRPDNVVTTEAGRNNGDNSYYPDDDRRNKNRQTARSAEPRQNTQRERTDARIRRTRRPS